MYNRYVFLIFILIFLFGVSSGFAEEKFPFYPSSQQNISLEEFYLQTTVKKQAELIKKEFFGGLYQCQAVRENSLSYCEKDQSAVENCKKIATRIMDLRTVTEGRCDGLNIFPSDICKALNEGNCSNLTPKDAREICEAFLKRNPSLLYKEFGKRVFKFKEFSDAEEMINIYYGFKFFSIAACDKFRSWKEGGYYLQKLVCKVLFSPESPQEIIDDAALELAYLNYVKDIKQDTTVCDRIKNPDIRDACRDPRLKSFTSFIENK